MSRPVSSFTFTVDNLADPPLQFFCSFCAFSRHARDMAAGMAFMQEHFSEAPLCREALSDQYDAEQEASA